MALETVRQQLEASAQRYNHPGFIADDPISLPRSFERLADAEIIGFWIAMLSWGQRKSIISSGHKLVALMDGAPHQFVLQHQERDRARFAEFCHRTFQYTDTLYFLSFLQWYYQQHDSLEDAFARFLQPADPTVEPALRGFHDLFFSLPYAPERTKKHVATPARKSTCKRLNMFLRWMVRHDDRGVDMGHWQRISPSQLLIPLDVHVDKVARSLGLLTRKQSDWQAVLELTEALRAFDAQDPVRYDFALFGMGIHLKAKP